MPAPPSFPPRRPAQGQPSPNDRLPRGSKGRRDGWRVFFYEVGASYTYEADCVNVLRARAAGCAWRTAEGGGGR